jgi:hypothetical protein
MNLPDSPLTLLPDSDFELVAWDAEANQLTAWIIKDASPETGLLTFRGVSLISIQPRMEIGGMEIVPWTDLPAEIKPMLYEERDLSILGYLFRIHGSWGEVGYILAEQVDYTNQQDVQLR